VVPGDGGTALVTNPRKMQAGHDSPDFTPKELAQMRARVASMGVDGSKLSDEDIGKRADERARRFLEDAPTSASEAAKIILDGVKAERWRILVGKDAEKIDRLV